MKLTDIAQEAGVSVSTASRALSRAYGVNKKTRAQVLKVADKLGYRPNRIAQGLVTGRSHTIGLLISDIRNPFFAEVARGAEHAAFASGFDLVLCSSALDRDRQMAYIRSLLEKRVAGILMNSVAGLSPAESQELAECGVPIVLLNRPQGKTQFSTVLADNVQGGYLAGKHLIELGHRKIAHLSGRHNHGNLTDRKKGFLRAVADANGDVKPIVMHGRHSYEDAYRMTRTLLKQHPSVTAISAGNDVMAFGAQRALTEAGRRVPDDVSLVGFDNVEISQIIQPPLTTVEQPTHDVGQAAAEILIRQADAGEKRLPEHRLFGVKLVRRHSCQALGQSG